MSVSVRVCASAFMCVSDGAGDQRATGHYK